MSSLRSLSCRLAASALLLAAACGENPAAADNLSVTSSFGGFSAVQIAEDVSSPSAGSAPGTIRIEGTFALPGRCYDMGARVEASAQFTVFYAIAEKRAGGCAVEVGQVSYTATISGASPGTHTVVVRHETDDTKTISTVNVTTLNVVVH